MYSYGILVVFVVLLAKCLKWLTNTRTQHVLVVVRNCTLTHIILTVQFHAQYTAYVGAIVTYHFHPIVFYNNRILG